jgi:hypothetical protein
MLPDDILGIVAEMLGADVIRLHGILDVEPFMKIMAKKIDPRITLQDFIWICKKNRDTTFVSRYYSKHVFGLEYYQLNKLKVIKKYIHIENYKQRFFCPQYKIQDIIKVSLKKYGTIEKLIEHQKKLDKERRLSQEKNRWYKNILKRKFHLI